MTFNQTPHLVVQRELDNGTNLCEFWVLDSCFWYDRDNMEAGEDPPLKCYVARWTGTRDITKAGIPPEKRRCSDKCSWSEAPQEVRDQFRDEAERIQQYVEMLE